MNKQTVVRERALERRRRRSCILYDLSSYLRFSSGGLLPGSSWVGWMNNGSRNAGRVELVFEFHSARVLNSLTLHLARAPVDYYAASANQSKGLTACLVNFGLESGNYLGKSIRWTPPAQQPETSEPIYNVTVDLKGRVARFLQIQLQFNSQWLLISEVTFQSGTEFSSFEYLIRPRYPFFTFSSNSIEPGPSLFDNSFLASLFSSIG